METHTDNGRERETLMSYKNEKRAKCPTCFPDGEVYAIYRRESDFGDDGNWVRFWECCNCRHRLPIGKPKFSKKGQAQALQNIREAIEVSGSEQFPTVIEEWEAKNQDDGTIHLTVWAAQGGEGNMLHCVTRRLLGIHIGRTGSIKVYSDSRDHDATKKTLNWLARCLKRGGGFSW